jgi:hypothetical protein
LYPDLWLFVRGGINGNDVVGGLTSSGKDTSSSGGLVTWASIIVLASLKVFLRLEVNDWHLVVHFTWELVGNSHGLSVPSCSVHVQTIDVDSILGLFLNLILSFLDQDLEGELKLVNSNLIHSSMSLKHTSHETLWEEESGDPETLWLSLLEP